MAVISTGFGGWVQMCTELMVDQEKWFQKDFSKIYSAYAKQNIKHQGYLSGLHEIQNQSNGKDIKPQIEYVGDKKQMLKIAENVHGNIENSVDLSNLSNSLTKEI
jgi:ribosomal protein S8